MKTKEKKVVVKKPVKKSKDGYTQQDFAKIKKMLGQKENDMLVVLAQSEGGISCFMNGDVRLVLKSLKEAEREAAWGGIQQMVGSFIKNKK